MAGYFLILAWPALSSSAAFGGDPSRTPQSAPTNQLPLEIGLALSVLAIVFILGWGREARVTSRPAWGGLWYFLPPALITFGILGVGILSATQDDYLGFVAMMASNLMASILVLVIFVGIFEEVLFRGIVLHGLEVRTGPIAALLLSSFLFGSMHYVNWIGGQDLISTHKQVLHAGLSGLLYGAITLRCRSIWPAAALHAFWDFTVIINGALLGGVPGQLDQEASPDGLGGMAFAFAFQNFEPILGVITLLGWYRWSRRAVPA
jgi:membrane protease YdiL (CAAX protease family)